MVTGVARQSSDIEEERLVQASSQTREAKTAGRTCRLCVTIWKSAKNSRRKIFHLEMNTHRQMDCVLAFLSLDICQECVRLHPTHFYVNFKRQEGNEGSGGGNSDPNNDSGQLKAQGGSTTCSQCSSFCLSGNSTDKNALLQIGCLSVTLHRKSLCYS